MTTTQPHTSRRVEELTLRMLGESVTFTRTQWEALRDMLNPTEAYDRADAIDLAGRIDRLVTLDHADDPLPVYHVDNEGHAIHDA